MIELYNHPRSSARLFDPPSALRALKREEDEKKAAGELSTLADREPIY